MSRLFLKIIMGLSLFFLCFTPAAQASGGPSYRFLHLSIEEGLSQSSVLAILQDRQGFMWFATLDGLNKYDGHKFTVYKPDPANPAAISDKFISAMSEDPTGILWLGTDSGGLDRFDPLTETFRPYLADPDDVHSLSSNLVQALWVDRAGLVWVGTDKGLNKFDPATETFTRYQHSPNAANSLSHDSVRAIYQDRAGLLWIGTEGGLNRFDPASGLFTVYRHDPAEAHSLSDNYVRAIYEDRQGTLWVGTERGLNRLDRASGTFTVYQPQPGNPHALDDDTVLAIYEDREGVLWVGTSGGLNRLDRATGSFSVYQHQPGNPASLSSKGVQAIYQDRSGVLWLGTRQGGVSKLIPTARVFNLYQHDSTDPYSLSDNTIWSVYTDRQGGLWVGASNGLNRYDPASQSFSLYRHEPGNPFSLSHDVVISMVEDRRGILWLGTDDGFDRFDPATGTFTTYKHDPENPRSLSQDSTGFVYLDRRGELWVGTVDGLNLFDPVSQTFTVYKHDPADPHSLGGAGVWAMCEDRTGALWVGMGGGGLSKFDRASQTFTTYRHDPANPASLSHNVIMSIYEDRAGTLWIGTFGGGLNKFNRASETFTAYTERDGLANDTVYGILEDKTGQLWLSTIDGLSRFDPVTETFRNYDANDGLQSNEFSVRAFHQAENGLFYFGGVNGLTVFDPARLQDNPYPPPVVLTSFEKFNQPVKLDRPLAQLSTLALSYRDYVVSFEFAALDYTNPAKNQYAYQLVGFDRDWIQAGRRNFATYTNLKGGDYTFRVKAANNDGIWNEQGLTIKVQVTPPFWQTWWAYGLYILALGGAVVGLVWLRTRSQAQELERQRQLNERLLQVDSLKDEFLAHTSHELRTPLNGIIGLTESLVAGATGQLPAETIANLQMVIASGRRLTGLVNNILDFFRLKHHDLALNRQPVDMYSLTEVVLTVCKPLIGQKPVQLYNYIHRETPLVEADENRVQQVMYNLVGNAVKWTNTGQVTVSAALAPGQPDMLAITVADTGSGIPADKLDLIFESFEQVTDAYVPDIYGGAGLGLAISRQLVTLHGGQIQVESEVGQGSRFTFSLPLSRQLVLPEPTEVHSAPLAKPAAVPRGLAESDEAALQPGAYTILVVDDDPVNLQVLANQLALEHYAVSVALSGIAALAAIEDGLNPDLLILDVLMPTLSGYEVCRILRQQYSLLDLPILILTAKNQPEDLLLGLEVGANDYLLKPFDRRQLLARVKNLLSLRQLNLDLQREIDQRTQAQAALERTNEQLEERVTARTAELLAANTQLSQEIIERIQAEAALEKLVEELDAFAHTVAHDLKNPIAVMVGYASLLEENPETMLSSAGQELADHIIQMGHKMNSIIEALLLLAHIQQEEVQVTPLDMAAIIAETEPRLASLVAERQAELSWPADWPVALGYGPWVEEVWFNYLSNAIKYGGRPPRVELGATPQADGTIRFWVRDNGPGLSPDQQVQLFTPFKRFNSEQEGQGLGLTIVQRVIEKLGGQVGVESNGQGSLFYFTLPAGG